MSTITTTIAVIAIALVILVIGALNDYSVHEEFTSEWFPEEYASFAALILQAVFCGATILLWELMKYATSV